MIFEFDRKTGSWDLLADTGELIGMARPIPETDGCWEVQMTVLFGGRQAFATHLDTAREWMKKEATTPR